MKYFHHNMIRKYTGALLDTLNDIQVERQTKNGLDYITVPITFGSKDKAFVMTQTETEQFLTNNYNVLPRMSLTLMNMMKDPKRDTHRLHTINKTINDETVVFQHNATSWTFIYEVAIATRSMTELAMIIEQILPMFNPTVNLRIKELDLSDEDVTVPVHLQSVDIDTPTNMGQDEDIRICTGLLILELKGNLYLPYKEEKLINCAGLILNTYLGDSEKRKEESRKMTEFGFDIENRKVIVTKFNDKEGNMYPEDYPEAEEDNFDIELETEDPEDP